jgi:hypothetical protein
MRFSPGLLMIRSSLPRPHFLDTDFNMTPYVRDYRGVSAMGCQEKYQFCNTAADICTPLTGQRTIENYLWNKLEYNDRQSTTQKMLGIANKLNCLDQLLI